jgi:hypothetical protein
VYMVKFRNYRSLGIWWFWPSANLTGRRSVADRLVRRSVPMVSVTVLALAGCVDFPIGPSIAVMPAPNKPFDVFVQDDRLCQGWAAHSIGVPGHNEAVERVLATTLTGAVIGAIIGGPRNVEGGAVMGSVIGASVGSGQTFAIAAETQRRFDIAYQQCMYSRGNFVPFYGYPTSRYTPPQAPPVEPIPVPPPIFK